MTEKIDKAATNESRRSMLLVIAAIAGIIAPLFYFAATLIGGYITPNYSNIANSISGLIARGQPFKPLLDAIFLPYNILLIPFAYGLYYGIRSRQNDRGSRIGSITLRLAGIFGIILTLFFPLDPGETATTITGVMHIIVVGLITPLMTLSILATGYKSRQDSGGFTTRR